MYGNCLEGVWQVSVDYLESVWNVSGGCLKGVWSISIGCLNGMWGVKMYLKGNSGQVRIGQGQVRDRSSQIS